MRALLWLVLLFLLATLLALLAGGNQAVVTVYWSPTQAIDLSLNLVVAVIVGLFLLGLWAVYRIARGWLRLNDRQPMPA